MKKIIATFLVLTMMLSMLVISTSADAWDGTSASASLKGEGTADNPYLVESAEDLKYIQVQVNEGNKFEGKYFKQTADIDLGNKEWTPIGERTAKPFIGLYDGNGYKIVNFYQSFSYRFGGLFAYMTTSADFTPGLINITLEGKMDGGTRVGDIYSGALLGWCQQSGSHTNKIVLANCKVDVDINFDSTGKGNTGSVIIAGVLARTGYVNIFNCVNYGDISVTGDGSQLQVGGAVAYAVDTDIINCYNEGNVTVKSLTATDIYCGGTLGTTATSKIPLLIDNCINYGTVISEGGKSNYTGGVVGCSAGVNTTIINCVNTADVTSKSSSATALPYAGGLLGYTSRTGVVVYSSYNSGTIVTIDDNSSKDAPGGIVGVMNNTSETTHIKDCTTTTKTYKGYMDPNNTATNCVVEADVAVVDAALKTVSDKIAAATSATVNGVVFTFINEPVAPPAPETTEPAPETTEPAPETTEPAPETTEPAPETTEPGSSTPTGDSALIFAIIAVISVLGVAVVAKRREN